MVLYDNDLYVMNGRNKVLQVRNSDGWQMATVVKTDQTGYDQATTNVVAEKKIYTLNARIDEVSAAVAAKNSSLLQVGAYSIRQFRKNDSLESIAEKIHNSLPFFTPIRWRKLRRLPAH